MAAQLQKRGNATRELVLLALLSTLMLVLQVALAALPNVEMVSLLVLLYTLHYRKKAIAVIYVFVLCEGLIYGFGLWFINYLYVWTVLWGIAMLCRSVDSPIAWALILGMYGLMFGLLCALPYVFIGGVRMAWAYFLNGIPFDLAHGASNLAIALALFGPLHRLFSMANRKLGLTQQ
jgi:energy-coupling factor transport system substrate-specific component